MEITTIQTYSYTERDARGHFFRASYSIRKGVKPLGMPGEKLEQEFDINHYTEDERDEATNLLDNIKEFDSRQ